MAHVSGRELAALADAVGWFSLPETERHEYEQLAEAVLDTVALVTDAPLGGDDPGPTGEARSVRRPTEADDPLNAIVHWADVPPTGDGALSGMRIAVKDSVSVASVPMTLGSRILDDFRPRRDSVVAERILAAGGRIVAATNMDDFAFSGGGETSAFGPVRNPHDPRRAAGGSSGGSAAALSYADRVDAAIGTDQGGSIRVPAAWCGFLGLKPTFGAVPYTGIVGIDATFDHVGPMARNVGDLGLLLLAIAGPHPSDPRQRGLSFDPATVAAALESTSSDFTGLRVGVVSEGFSDDDALRAGTSAAVRAVAADLAGAGATVGPVSVPEHLQGGGIAFAGFVEGMYASALGGGNGYGWSGRYDPDLAAALHRGLVERGDLLSPQIKLVAMLGELLQRAESGGIYARAQNQRPALRAGYDRALADVDVLLMPTVPFTAHAIEPELGLSARALKGWAPLANCSPLNMTGHPAISVPAATADGLPVGVMLIGRHGGDARLLDVAGRMERAFGWSGAR